MLLKYPADAAAATAVSGVSGRLRVMLEGRVLRLNPRAFADFTSRIRKDAAL